MWEIPGKGIAKELAWSLVLAVGRAEPAASEDARSAAGSSSSSLVLAGVLLSLAEPGPGAGGAFY